MNKINLDSVRAKWLNQCGPCDAGLFMGCTCPEEDHRPVILALVNHLEDLYNNYDMLLCSDMGDAVDRALHFERMAEIRTHHVRALIQWLEDPNGSFSSGRVTIEAITDGGILVRTRAYRGLDNHTS